MTSHPLYNTWRGMVERCTNVNCSAYQRYGKKGIKIFSEWTDKSRNPNVNRWSVGFCNFLNYIETSLGAKPEGYSLDRICSQKNYEPKNLRWADSRLQKLNQTIRNKSGYKYVYQISNSNKWYADYKYKQERIYVGVFDNKEQAYFEALAHRLSTIWPENLG